MAASDHLGRSVCRTCGKKIGQDPKGNWSSHLGSDCWGGKLHNPIHTVMSEGLASSPTKVPTHMLNTTLFRNVRGDKLTTPLGIHWSSVSGLKDNEDPSGRFDTKGRGASLFTDTTHTLIEGKVSDKAIIDPHSSEGKKVKGRHAIWGAGFPEYEHTVRPGANVGITKITKFKGNGKKRSRIYNPPRQVQA